MMVKLAFGGRGNTAEGLLGAGGPLLRGEPFERLIEAAGPEDVGNGLSLWKGPEGMVGLARLDPKGDLETAAGSLYRELLGAASGLNLYRIWNFVPGINGAAAGGLENYRAFCRGRSLAFESLLGPGFTRCLPAASAVGTEAPDLTIVFIAGPCPVVHHENPGQLPAYNYPEEHGPRSPSFSRATVVGRGDAVDAYVSGTSSVVGHETVAPGDTVGQLECTIGNLRRISKACGLGENLCSQGPGLRHFRVYLRRAGDLGLVSEEMARQGVIAPGDAVSYLRADICRSALNVEIEVAVRGAIRT